MDGILGLDKPAGLTSFDVVAKLRKDTGERQIGHTGTLDPDATGVLVICFGRATRISSMLMRGTKRYSAEICFGTSTNTADASGSPLLVDPEMRIGRMPFEDALSSFIGIIEQRTPMFSAVKVGGKKLYELARQGLEAERPERQVTIHSLTASVPDEKDFIVYGDRIPLTIDCSHGTYIRTLCEDIGKALGVPSHMYSLRRTWSSGWDIGECLSLEKAASLATEGQLYKRLIGISEALGWMPALRLEDADIRLICHGGSIVAQTPEEAMEVLLTDAKGRAVAIARAFRLPSSDGGKSILKPKSVFMRPEDTANA